MSFSFEQLPQLWEDVQSLKRDVAAVLNALKAGGATIASESTPAAPAPATSAAAAESTPTQPVTFGAIKGLEGEGAVSDAGGKNDLQALIGLGLAFVSSQNDHVKIDSKGSPLKFTAKNELGATATVTINGSIDVDLAF